MSTFNIPFNHKYILDIFCNNKLFNITCIYDDDDDIKFISTKIGSCRPLRSCGKKIIIK